MPSKSPGSSNRYTGPGSSYGQNRRVGTGQDAPKKKTGSGAAMPPSAGAKPKAEPTAPPAAKPAPTAGPMPKPTPAPGMPPAAKPMAPPTTLGGALGGVASRPQVPTFTGTATPSPIGGPMSIPGTQVYGMGQDKKVGSGQAAKKPPKAPKPRMKPGGANVPPAGRRPGALAEMKEVPLPFRRGK